MNKQEEETAVSFPVPVAAPPRGRVPLSEAERCMQRILSGENLAVQQGVTIDDLPAAGAISDTDLIEIQSAAHGSQHITIAQIKTASGAGTCTCQAASDAEIDALF